MESLLYHNVAELHLPVEIMAHKSGLPICRFHLVNGPPFCSFKQAVQGTLPPDQSFYPRLCPTQRATFIKVCAFCLSACHPEGLHNIRSGWYLSPVHKSTCEPLGYVRSVWVRAEPTKRQRFPPVSGVRWRVNSCWPQTFFVGFFFFFWHTTTAETHILCAVKTVKIMQKLIIKRWLM